MSLMKVAGKQFISSTYTDTALTYSAGMLAPDGTEIASVNYMKTNKFSVTSKDIITLVKPSNSQEYPARYLTAFNGDTVVQRAGIDSPAMSDNVHYTVPDGVDGIVLTVTNSISTNATVARITKETAFARPFSVDANGVINTHHIWESRLKTICGRQSIRDTAAHVFPAVGENLVDISDYAITSLRITCTLDQPCTMRFISDAASDAGGWLADKDGRVYAFTIPNGNNVFTLTPDDFPMLNYLRGIRVRLNCETAPTDGVIAIDAICKR